MRLIDADKLIKELNELRYETISPNIRRAVHNAVANCQNLIENQPTEHDVDKVIERFMEIREKIFLDSSYDKNTANHCLAYIDSMIEIEKSCFKWM